MSYQSQIPHRSGRRAFAALVLSLTLVSVVESGAALQSAATLASATCEATGPHSYRIDFGSGALDGPVQIYASASPDRIDAIQPVATARTSPAIVTVPDRKGRVYFHLKPRSGPTRVVAPRQVPLEGALNFRDLGGYATTDGRFVRWGRLFRSDHLMALTVSDYEYLRTIGLRLVCDLRTPSERRTAPTKWQGPSPEFIEPGILTDADLAAAMAPVPADEFKRRLAAATSGTPEMMGSTYGRFVLEYADSYRQVFQRLVSGDLPAVTHCTGGRDRTGVYSAILLTLLGVPRETVEADYLLTDRYRLTDALVAQQAKDWKAQYQLDALPRPAVVRTMRGLNPETMRATFDVIAREHGSFDGFRRKALGISDRDLTAFRDRVLEK